MAVIKTGAQINPILLKVVDGGPNDGEALDINNELCSISGLPQDSMATDPEDPIYKEDPATTLTCVDCPTISLTFEVVNESTTTAQVTVIPSGGTGPYTYLWSNSQTTATATGLLKDTEYTVLVTDSNSCTATGVVTPNVQILTGLTLELMYFGNSTVVTSDAFYPRICGVGTHSCNNARFEVFCNSVSQGVANLNNAAGTVSPDIDDHNTPPGSYDSPSSFDRYWSVTLSGADAADIAGSGGTVLVTINYIGTGTPHSDASWFRITKEDGTVLSSTCVTEFAGYTFDPYS